MRLAPWADVVYGCDGPWWRFRNGLPEFSGVKLSNDTPACTAYRDLHKVEVLDHNKLEFSTPGVLGTGGNSGFQAINLAAQFGVNRILLIGFDMNATAALHWYGRNTWRGANNPAVSNFMRWRDAIFAQAPVLKAMGIDVVNASRESALTCFVHKPIEQALSDWGL